MKSMADPGFPRGGGANSPGGHQHTIFPNVPKNCMELKEFGPPEGACVPCALFRPSTGNKIKEVRTQLTPSLFKT